MSNYRLSLQSIRNLVGVDGDLVCVVVRALQVADHDFSVAEGMRTIERQKDLVKRGRSKTLRSKHIVGRAVDLWPYPLDWGDRDSFAEVARAMKQAARELSVKIEWGYDLWGWDMPHFQLADD